MQEIPVKNRFDEIFRIEFDAWCDGLSSYAGEPFAGLAHRVIKELGLCFREAIRNHYAFDILAAGKNIAKAARFIITPREAAFAILVQLPNPLHLDDDGKFVLANVIDQLEGEYGGALNALQRKWSHDRKETVRDLAAAGGTEMAAKIQAMPIEEVSITPIPEKACAFFSHSSRDKSTVRRIADGIEQQGVRVWLDERQLDAAGSVYLPIDAGLAESQYILIAVSQHSAESDWIKQEIRMAVRKVGGGQPKVFVALRLDDSRLPWWLDGIAYFDFRQAETFDNTCQSLADSLIATLPNLDKAARLQSPPTIDDDTSERWTKVSAVPTAAIISNTRGWSQQQILDAIEAVKRDKLGWQATEGSARHWWIAFENENADRAALVLRLAEELAARRATISEFFLAYVYSNTDNIQANLHYLDYFLLKQKGTKKVLPKER